MLIKNGGNQRITFFHKLCIAIWMKKEWPVDWVNSIFPPIPKQGDVLQCSNNSTIALISHCSKILLKIVSNLKWTKKLMRYKLVLDLELEQGTKPSILN